MNAYLAHIRMNLRLTLRNRATLVFAYMFPLIFFGIFGAVGMGRGGGTQLINMTLGMGVIGSGLFGVGLRAVMDREQNILRRFKVAPISPGPILVSGMVTGFLHQIPLMALTLFLAHRFYGAAWPGSPLPLIGLVMVGYAAFSAIGSMVASVVNSMQESQIITQILYFAFLFLGGTTFPVSIMPNWLQQVSQFMPTAHFTTALLPILSGQETLLDNLVPVGALALTAALGLFLGIKLFRWEKEERLEPKAKLWLAAVLAPFLLMGGWQLVAKSNVTKAHVLFRQAARNRATLIRDARVFPGQGSVLERASVLLKDGKIAEIYTGDAPEAKALNADEVAAAGKTLLPGLIDAHVHLGNPGGIWEDPTQYTKLDQGMDRELAAYLFSGVTAVRSLGDMLDNVLAHRLKVNSGEKLGAELFAVGPLFTTKGGHGFEFTQQVPERMRQTMVEQFLRTPQTPEEAKAQVADLKKRGVDGIKVALESSRGTRMSVPILNAIVDAAHAEMLTVAAHTGSAQDVSDALDAKVDSIEHGSFVDRIPDETFARMKAAGVHYSPTLAVLEGIALMQEGRTTPFERTLVVQAAPPHLIEQTKNALAKLPKSIPIPMEIAKANLLAAFRAGVILSAGTDSGSLMLIHGPAVHRELQLWVEAGVPTSEALKAATFSNAQLLGAESRMGQVMKGLDASLLLVDGNPLEDISATERISAVFLKGERINRSDVLKEDQ